MGTRAAQGSLSPIVLDPGNTTHSAVDAESTNHSAIDGDGRTRSALDTSSPTYSALDGDDPALSAVDESSPPHSALDEGSRPHSVLDGGNSPHSTLDEGSRPHSELDGGSRPHSALESDTSSLFSHGPGSPSILERTSTTNSNVQVLETSRRLLHELSREYSEIDNEADLFLPSPRRQDRGNSVDEAQRRLNTVATRRGIIVQRQINFRGGSFTVSLTNGEDSSQSLPETSAQSDTDKDTGNTEPPAKVRKISSPDKKEDLDGETCPICLDTWSNSGTHRLVALKCGHLFGAECVERWLKAQPSKDRSCPTCKTKAGLKDLRFIYARRLIAADTSEITRLQMRVDCLQAEKNRAELDLQSARMSQRLLTSQVEDLKKMLSQKVEVQRKPSWRFALEKNLEICKGDGCRVLTYNCRTYELYVSQKSGNYLFPGYGIRKVSCLDYTNYTLGQFVHLHPKPIRDITYSHSTDLLLSVGLDSTARIVERGIPNMTVNAGFPLWSCAWDRHNNNEFYVGGLGGMIHQYDFRNPTSSLRTLCGTGDMSPVISVYSTDHGLLSCQLNSCWLWEKREETGEWVPKVFPVNGGFISMCYNYDTDNVLLSMRPNGRERSKLTVCSLAPYVGGGADIKIEYVLSGSTRSSVLSRSTFCKVPGATWVAAHSESDSTLYLHGLNGVRSMSLPSAETALDLCSVQLNGSSLLAALSESRLRIYKAVELG